MKVGVIGSGSIGPDLAYGFLSALARIPSARVVLVDIRQDALDQGRARIRGYVQKAVAKGKLRAKAAEAFESALVASLRLQDLAECDYVLEAASEDLSIKRRILADLENVVRPDCLVGFATSGIPRAAIAAEARHPERCFVNHPFFPAWRSLPVEVVLSGDDAYGARMMSTLRHLGKVPVVTADVPCFAADDIFCNYVSEAARIVEEALATPAQVDRIVHEAIGGGGPFAVLDGTRGNLLTAHCQRLMQDGPNGTAWFAPPAILESRGGAPWHDRDNPGDPAHDEDLARRVLDRILAVLLARTYAVVDQRVCAPTELNWMTRSALGFKRGLLELAEDLGAERVHALVTAYAAENPGFMVPPSLSGRTLVRFRRTVAVERHGSVGLVRVFRPEVKNALSNTTIEEIDAAFRELERDDSVDGIIFTSADGSLAGADITELAALPDAAASEALCHRAHRVMQRIARLDKPVVAAVDGPVMGGGAEFAMACHGRVVGPRLVMSQPEVNLGLIPGYGGTMRLPRLIGLEKASVMVRAATPAGAEEAVASGWATVASDEIEAAARELLHAHHTGARRLAPVDEAPMEVPAELPPVDIGHRSRAIDAIAVEVLLEGLKRPLEEGLAVEAAGFGRCRETKDMEIGLKNFLENGPRAPAPFIHE